MGCNSTKQADIFQDRQRISREQKQERGHEHESKIAPKAPPRSKPRGIERPADDDDDKKTELDNGGKTYGSSYTGNHLLERDFFLQNVLRRDQHKFIDVLSELTTIDEKEAVERVQKYARIQFDPHRDSSECEDDAVMRSDKYIDSRATNSEGDKGASGSIDNIVKILSERRILNEKVIADFESIADLLMLKNGGGAVDPETDEDEKDSITVSW
mmetsp:Transcript_6391/g.8878  ORF Transcript_6391/g.8878 Transcript_6391/m.8878 type:complete len:214 (+) Transcript_6391:77-718(+)